MKIHIVDDLYITSDKHCIKVSKELETPKGIELRDISFHSDIGGAIRSALERKIRESRVRSFSGLEKEYRKMNALLDKLTQELKI